MTKISCSETVSDDGPQCPYCGEFATPDEAFFFDEYNFTEWECGDCNKKFDVSVCNYATWTCTIKEEAK